MTYVLQAPLAAYPYVQYNDDDDIVAFFMSFNETAQGFVDFFNEYNFGDINSEKISGAMLDWCAQSIYGIKRPYIVTGVAGETFGPYGFGAYGFTAYGVYDRETGTDNTYYYVDDDVFRKVIQWNFYKGDGNIFTVEWLKRRVARFLTGENYPQETNDIAVIFDGGNTIEVQVPMSNPLSETLDALVGVNALTFPFQYSLSVTAV